MPNEDDDALNKARKLARFTTIYGPRRTLTKALGRLRSVTADVPALGRVTSTTASASLPRAAMIGCGQFAYATMSYFLRDVARVVTCFDIDREAAVSLARAHTGCRVADEAAQAIAADDVDIVYIASNHASHTDYAVAALAAGKDVYVEKPIAVSHMQLERLTAAVRSTSRRIACGYNRPFSAAVADLRASVGVVAGPLTLSCFISGHQLGADHWYRHPDEGTRVCGNVGHWLDLAVHMLGWRHLPDAWRITAHWSNDDARDDDVALTMTSDAGDLVSIVLTARTEPFEGINESINVQWGETIAKIDDFRRQTIWRGGRLTQRRYWPKDVGHGRAITQPFRAERRPWREVEDSTLLMLHIMEMVQSATPSSTFSFGEARARLDAAVGEALRAQ